MESMKLVMSIVIVSIDRHAWSVSKMIATCGGSCQNQRFQNRNYANVSVIQTEKKGYGLRANVDIPPHTFIYEYIGEVIDEPNFRQRTNKYADEGIKHFYFMSIKKGEFIDATKKGCLARFCNHSCNPNCMVEKWVVGDKLRMGIFSNEHIRAGEELTFDYNVDRYGAEPQACFCGEPNCIGYIGGKTQTEAATKLPAIFVEALGIDDADGWTTATAKKPKRRKGEDDEDYVSSIKTRALEKDNVQKVMGSLLQSKETMDCCSTAGSHSTYRGHECSSGGYENTRLSDFQQHYPRVER